MKKTLLSFFAILLLSGCTSTTPSTVEPTVEPTTEPENDLEAGWELYTDTTLGIQFEYPSAWGPITVHDEMGLDVAIFEADAGISMDDLPHNEDGEIVYDGIYNRDLSFSGLGSIKTFLVANNDDVGILGRGGFWGDRSAGFHTQAGVQSYCDENESCEMFTNENGLSIAHIFHDEMNVFDQIYTNVDEYAIFHPGHSFGGLIISSQFLGSDYSADLRAVVDSLSFVD